MCTVLLSTFELIIVHIIDIAINAKGISIATMNFYAKNIDMTAIKRKSSVARGEGIGNYGNCSLSW